MQVTLDEILAELHDSARRIAALEAAHAPAQVPVMMEGDKKVKAATR